MIEIKSLNNSTGENNPPVESNKKSASYLIVDGLSTDDLSKIFGEILNKVIEKANQLDDAILKNESKLEAYKKEVDKQTSKNIETIGVFSAILALLIIDVSIIKSATSFLPAILLITSLAVVLGFFSILIHILFSPEEKKRLTNKTMWLPILILIIFIVLGILSEVNKWSWAEWSQNNNQSNK